MTQKKPLASCHAIFNFPAPLLFSCIPPNKQLVLEILPWDLLLVWREADIIKTPWSNLLCSDSSHKNVLP